MSQKPDFLCIGMQKAATGFFYDLCVRSDVFWMPMIKEFHHFDEMLIPEDSGIHTGVLDRWKSRSKQVKLYAGASDKARLKANVLRVLSGQRRLDARDFEFWDRYKDYMEADRSDETYVSLFEPCPNGCIVGDITPAYSVLLEEDIRHVHSVLPQCSIIFFVRDPVKRAWSHFNMISRRQAGLRLSRKRKEACMREIMGAPGALSEFLASPELMRRAFPSQIYKNWAAVYGADRIKVVFFDEFVKDPQGVFGDIVSFLRDRTASLPHAAPSSDKPVALPKNLKGAAAKVPLDTTSRNQLVEFFADEIRACRECFETGAERWLVEYALT